MRILHVIESLEFGGAERIVISLANAMSRGHQVAICCVKSVGELGGEVERGVEVFSLGKREGNDYALPLRMAGVLRRGSYDVLHTHNWGVFLEAGMGAILAGTPVRVHTAHGTYRDYGPGTVARLKLALRHLLERQVSRRYDYMVGVSDAIARSLVDDIGVPAGKARTVHNGIPVDGEAAPAPVVRDETVFVSVGRLAEVKNHGLMLRAFRRALDAGIRARLLIAGDGPQRAAIEADLARLDLGASVEMLGFRTDVPKVLQEAHVFVLTSRYEGISVALLESMRRAIPSVATRVGGIPETVRDGETGLLFAADDEAGIAAALVELARDPARRASLGRAARQRLVEEFSLERMTMTYLDFYAAAAKA